jgi:hypothetical protein
MCRRKKSAAMKKTEISSHKSKCNATLSNSDCRWKQNENDRVDKHAKYMNSETTIEKSAGGSKGGVMLNFKSRVSGG